ncbi:MAG: hypothetical protein O7E56_09155 [SAR324 cluster bacterium]|nr:hypothetical protein [SAR324 cluster bacterium]MCZ6628381.1 hypothetical protein [SAR324 cluster bacterium]MCZ6730312.1 hypothetical protein [SAR324 cluster bacterium]
MRFKKLKLKVPLALLQRVDAAAAQVRASRKDFLRQAIESELERFELEQTREEIAFQEIRRNVLAEGQAVDISAEEESPDEKSATHHCEMCMKSLPPPPFPVQGPLFCEACMGIARGAFMPK